MPGIITKRVEWIEEELRGRYHIIADNISGEWKFSEKLLGELGEVHWYKIPATPELVSRLSEELKKLKESSTS